VCQNVKHKISLVLSIKSARIHPLEHSAFAQKVKKRTSTGSVLKNVTKINAREIHVLETQNVRIYAKNTSANAILDIIGSMDSACPNVTEISVKMVISAAKLENATTNAKATSASVRKVICCIKINAFRNAIS